MPKRIDLTGRKFGRLTAVEMTDKRNRNGSIYWKCRCDCGRETFVTSDVLRRGAVKSCGCLFRGMDITGQRFGQLTALYPTTKRDQKHSVLWHCR